ncbi:MAG: Holliday junction branch migration protein RuvA [Salinivirgaceae bacterium]|nr:Holliday junction branch migration protein RuvA [Salinivirgaceae bacterium]
MYEYIQGRIAELTPAFVVIDNGGIGYMILISLNTYTSLSGKEQAIVFTHYIVREDAQLLYGFASKTEREVFRLLLTVSGVGANTARMVLSSLSASELRDAVLTGNVAMIKSIKGVGQKTAERIIVDLKDKIGKTEANTDFLFAQSNTNREEALSALVALGFQKNVVEKLLDKLLKENPTMQVEEMVKKALKSI